MIGFDGAWRTLIDFLGIRVTSKPDDEPLDLAARAESALRYAPVWYAINKIAGHVGYLPLNIHHQVGRNIEKDVSHPAYRLLRWQPNELQTPIQFKRSLTADALLWGNGYAYIHRDAKNVKELVPLYAGAMACGMLNGEKVLLYHLNRNERVSLWKDIEDAPDQVVQFTANEILHIHGLGFNGIVGHSLLKLASQSWSAGENAIRRINSQLQKGYSGGFMLEAPPGTFRKEEDAQQFLEHFRATHGGANQAGKIGMLREGIKANVMSMSNQDAQFVELMRFLRQEEALRFMLESILGDDSSVSYNSLEQKNLAYLQNCLNTWLKVWEEECDTKLLSEAEKLSGYYFKFNDGALLRSDKATTMRTIAMGITSRVLSPNEGREMLDMNPYEGGDTYENPAVSPGRPGIGTRDGEPDTEPQRQPQNLDSAKLVFLERVEHLIGVEANRVIHAASSSRNFLNWMEEWYPKWESKLADAFEKLGADRDIATWHCSESKGLLLMCAENATQDTLEQTVRDCVSNWNARAASIVNEMELSRV